MFPIRISHSSEMVDGFSKSAYTDITSNHLLFTSGFAREPGARNFYTAPSCKFARYSLEISRLVLAREFFAVHAITIIQHRLVWYLTSLTVLTAAACAFHWRHSPLHQSTRINAGPNAPPTLPNAALRVPRARHLCSFPARMTRWQDGPLTPS